MASSSATKRVVIDWSSSSTHSFVQLGTTPIPHKDSYAQDTEPEVTLSNRDIFFTDIDDILTLSTSVYTKLLHGFAIEPSYNTKMAKRQTKRFECNCRRVLQKEVIKPGGLPNISSKLGVAKAANFVFLPSDITHQKKQQLPVLIVNSNTTEIIPVIDNSQVVHTCEPFCPLPKFLNLPEHYKNIVPSNPMYNKDGKFIKPETAEWSRIMKKCDTIICDRENNKKDANIIARALNIFFDDEDKLMALRTGVMNSTNIENPLSRDPMTSSKRSKQDSKGKSAVFEDYLSSDTITAESHPLK
ncbi:hypothetical protein C1646_769181 [Rhizophagus diaphanus]|nr:hypothetical protein C1646_769181 [Rhizophagus diaphanus] [Rhizophagus sp. MUCL 43196]